MRKVLLAVAGMGLVGLFAGSASAQYNRGVARVAPGFRGGVASAYQGAAYRRGAVATAHRGTAYRGTAYRGGGQRGHAPAYAVPTRGHRYHRPHCSQPYPSPVLRPVYPGHPHARQGYRYPAYPSYRAGGISIQTRNLGLRIPF